MRQRSEATIHGAPSLQVPAYPQLRFSPRSTRWALATIADVRPDVVHVQNHFFLGRSFVRAAHAAAVPLVATNHFVPENFTVHADFLPAAVTAAVSELLWRDLARVYRDASLLTTPTPYAAELARTHHVAQSATAISCGVDIARFQPRRANPAALAQLGLANRPTCLVVGRLDRDKRIEDVIRAFAVVRAERDVQLVVVGRGKELQRLRRLADELGLGASAVFTGFVADALLPDVYSAAEIYVNAGIAELQSISTLEAMASGKPVLAADAMALPHLVRDGVNGYTFAPGNPTELADRLGELFDDGARRARMGTESRAIALGHDSRATVDSYADAYERALAAAGVADRSPAAAATGAGRTWAPRSPALWGLTACLAVIAIAASPVYDDVRPHDSLEWALYAQLVALAVLAAGWLVRRAADGGPDRDRSLPPG